MAEARGDVPALRGLPEEDRPGDTGRDPAPPARLDRACIGEGLHKIDRTAQRSEPPAAIRLAEERDAGQVAAIYAPVVRETAISFETEPPSTEEMRRRIEDTLRRFPWLVCERGGEVLGYAYAGAHRSRAAYRWSVEVSAYVREGERRRCVGRALYTSLFEILVLQSFYNAYAGITLPNPPSVGLHESVGFRPVGVYRGVGYKLGAWRDVGWWELPLQERAASPGEPLDLPQVRTSGGWESALARGLPLLRGTNR